MTKRRREIELPDVDALIGPHLRTGEFVFDRDRPRPDRFVVSLMERDTQLERMVEVFGLGGCGRTLEFSYKSGRWVFDGEGGWRS